MPKRDGKRKLRSDRVQKRVQNIGYYFIVTDTEETEKNYFIGLRNSFPEEIRRKLIIKVSKAGTDELVEEALEKRSISPHYAETWIVFDRDRVKNFDKIISQAQENDINVGWSNPCIEIWFSAYFGSMPKSIDSVACWKEFARIFKKETGQEYSKSDPDIYRKLRDNGDEEKAIDIASKKYHDQSMSYAAPSEMNPCTTVYTLVKEIIKKAR